MYNLILRVWACVRACVCVWERETNIAQRTSMIPPSVYSIMQSTLRRETVLWETQVFDMQNALYVSLRCVSQNIDEINLHLWSERLHKYTIWGIKGPAQVKADWQHHCLAGLHFISRNPRWPQALWPRGQCQSLRMLIKWDQPDPQTQVARLSSGESYLSAWAQFPSPHPAVLTQSRTSRHSTDTESVRMSHLMLQRLSQCT